MDKHSHRALALAHLSYEGVISLLYQVGDGPESVGHGQTHLTAFHECPRDVKKFRLLLLSYLLIHTTQTVRIVVIPWLRPRQVAATPHDIGENALQD